MSGGSWPYAGGWKDDQTIAVNNTISTPYHDPTPAGDATENSPGMWNIAKGRLPENQGQTLPPFLGDMHTLMYGGNYTTVPTTKIVVQLQGWFCNGVQSDGDCPSSPVFYQPNSSGPQWVPQYYGHADVQYTGWDQTVTDARVIDIWDRGGDTLAADWYGGPQDCPPLPSSSDPQYTFTGSGNVYTQYCDSNDTASGNKFGDDDLGFQHVMTSLQTTLPTYRPAASMDMFLIMDHGAWTWDCAKNTYNGFQYSGKNEPWCALGKMTNDLQYLYQTYYEPNGQPSSTYTTYGGLPIIAFFQNDDTANSPNSKNDFYQCDTITCVFNSVGGVEQTCTSSVQCFQDVYDQLRLEANSIFKGTNNYYLLFVNNEGCPIMQNGVNTGHPDSDGCYAWPGPWDAGTAGDINDYTQQYDYCTGVWQNGACSTATGGPEVALDNFYWNSVHKTCQASGGLLNGCTGDGGHQLILMGGAFKGFDDLMTNSPNAPGWYDARVATQGCGTTWVSSWGEMTEMSNWYSESQNPLPWMMVGTWDDYEEGTEIETGIDNCILSSSFVPTISGNMLNWSFNFDGSVRDPNHLANLNTIDHYDLYYTPQDSDEYYLVSHNVTNSQAGCQMQSYPTVRCSGINVSGYGFPSGSTVYVEAIGKPGITNWLSQGVSYP